MSGIDRDSDGDEHRASAEPDPPPQGGVLGNLPKRRPAVRSPRRETAKPEAGKSPAPAATESGAGTRDSVSRAAAGEQQPAGAEPEHSAAADLEGLARGGIAIAGGAASLGLRITGRAAAALRDAVERR